MKQKNKGKKVSRNVKQTQFTLDMDKKGLFLFLLMVLLTAGAVFYLGMIFGKASRDPNTPDIKSEKIIRKAATPKKTIAINKLEIFDTGDKGGSNTIKNLKKKTQHQLSKADRVMNERRIQEKPASAAKSSKPDQPVKKATKPRWPDVETTSDKSGDIYSIQVFATRDKDKADKIVAQLRKKAFDAYLLPAEIEGKKIFRVRVAKLMKSKIGKVKKRLDKVTSGMGMKSKLIKIN